MTILDFKEFNIEKPALGKIIEKLLYSLKNEEDFLRMIKFNEQALVLTELL